MTDPTEGNDVNDVLALLERIARATRDHIAIEAGDSWVSMWLEDPWVPEKSCSVEGTDLADALAKFCGKLVTEGEVKESVILGAA